MGGPPLNFMQKTLLVVGLAVMAIGLRSSRSPMIRKVGALLFLVTSFLAAAFIAHCWWAGVLGLVPWLMLPWVELLTRIRRLRLPGDNRLRHRETPDPSFFPHAAEAAVDLEEFGFEHVGDCDWEWSGMQQYLQIYWHPEEMAEATICLCEQGDVAFSFLSMTSRDRSGRILRTTNFPFSPTLKCPPHLLWNHVPCERNSVDLILGDHRRFLEKCRASAETLMVPDPEQIEEAIEAEMKCQIRHNLEAGIIRPSQDEVGTFEYSTRGLFFLWRQFVKDMVRLC